MRKSFSWKYGQKLPDATQKLITKSLKTLLLKERNLKNSRETTALAGNRFPRLRGMPHRVLMGFQEN